MSGLKLEGRIIDIFDKQQVTDTFSKREFVIETDEQYPQMVKFELVQAECELIDGHNIGDNITVHFNVRGRKWTNKEGKDTFFVSLNAWRIEAQKQVEYKPVSTAQDLPPVYNDQDIPF